MPANQSSNPGETVREGEEVIRSLFLEMENCLRTYIDNIERDRKSIPPEDFLFVFSSIFGVDESAVEAHIDELKTSLAQHEKLRKEGWPEFDYNSIP